jgi:FAD synthase
MNSFLGVPVFLPIKFFESVTWWVGTFDGLHFGHRKLLTLAMSSVNQLVDCWWAAAAKC